MFRSRMISAFFYLFLISGSLLGCLLVYCLFTGPPLSALMDVGVSALGVVVGVSAILMFSLIPRERDANHG